jgi:KaiC/GvpD/RAD55 family RecA-like ATPase
MKTVKLGGEIDKILTEGLPVNTSTLVSGPGGSGKPLIGYLFASGWLKNRGNVIFILTSTSLEYLKNMMKILGCDLDEYSNRVFFIELDPQIEDIEKMGEVSIKANFVKPQIWDEMLKIADNCLKKDGGIGTMVSGAALNLLFFSPTYGKEVHKKIKEILREDKSKTYFFTVNSDAFKNLVEELESEADNLMFSRMEKPMKLYLKIARMKGVPFIKEEVRVPLSKEILEEIKREAERGKKDLIPAIKRI